ncbi:MAG TPA: aldehyde dehydrogenase family protein [Ilumatobacter sp.]|nr:aldehyde dehydrogenase family protein [Ilumatobacter sp.]
MSTTLSRAAEVYVNGAWQAGGGSLLTVYRPYDGTELAVLTQASPEQAHAALASSSDAQREWARVPAVERGLLLRQLADLIAANKELLAGLITDEVGKRHSEAADELAFAESFIRYNAEWDRRLEGELLPGDSPGEQVHLRREPLGVIAAICPWNFPLAVLCRKLGPALLTGNTVVVKPSEISPLSTMALFDLIDAELDLPPGVVNLVVGDGSVGGTLVTDPLTSMVTFTGHRDTGKRVMAAAAANLTRVSLELGGKAPAIVWRDADLDIAVPSILQARHTNCGQVCTSAERVLVHRDIVDEFTDRYAGAVAEMRIGDPRDDVDLGPMASAAQLAKTGAALEAAVAGGATVVTGGAATPSGAAAGGYWHAPTVLSGVTADMAIAREEIFGPVTPIIAVDSLDATLKIANDSRYGLSAYVFSSDYATVLNTVDDLAFGEIYVNRTLGESVHAHHAGWKESGMGGEDGKWGMLRYTQIKTVYHHYGRA